MGPDDIHGKIAERLADRDRDAGLGSQVEDDVRAVRTNDLGDVVVRDIELLQACCAGEILRPAARQVVDDEDLLALREQAIDQVTADESAPPVTSARGLATAWASVRVVVTLSSPPVERSRRCLRGAVVVDQHGCIAIDVVRINHMFAKSSGCFLSLPPVIQEVRQRCRDRSRRHLRQDRSPIGTKELRDPPTALAITGRPSEPASTSTVGSPSLYDGSTSTSAADM